MKGGDCPSEQRRVRLGSKRKAMLKNGVKTTAIKTCIRGTAPHAPSEEQNVGDSRALNYGLSEKPFWD